MEVRNLALKSMLLAFALGTLPAMASDSSSDFRATEPSKSNVKGLVVRAPIENGEVNLKSAEHKVDTGDAKVSKKEDLEETWKKSFDVKGFGELTSKDTESKDSSNYYGYRYYYYNYYYFQPVYVYTFVTVNYIYYYYPTYYMYFN